MLRKRSKIYNFYPPLGSFYCPLFYLRMNKPKQLQSNAYRNWSANFVGTLDNKTYIKTEETADGQVTLSEAQGYGMLIAARAGQQKLASQKILTAFINII